MEIFYDYIFCKPVKDGAITSKGAYRGLQKEKPTQLEVVLIGKEVKKVKKGDIVLIEKYSGIETEIDDIEYTIIREKDLIAKLNKKRKINE